MSLWMIGLGTREDELGDAKAGRGAPSPRWRSRARRLALLTLAVLIAALARPAAHHARAASLLAAFSDPSAMPDVLEDVTEVVVPGRGPVRARAYRPSSGRGDLPGVVLVHGVHRLGIEEPRLRRFARALANAGVLVLTPEVSELSDYHVDATSIDTVGAATIELGRRLGGGRKAGLMGMSFGGGVALLTAADPRFADRAAFVVAVGAHDDLARVSRFFATSEIEGVSGEVRKQRAHEYGATVLVYTHAEDFFPAADVAASKEALRLWLAEKREEAREAHKRLSPPSRAKVERLFEADVAALREELLAQIELRKEQMRAVSPHGRLSGLRANVYLMHGAGDTVIPASETLWLAKDVPAAKLRAVLVSPAVVHVELREPTARDRWELVHFMGRVISEAEEA